MARAGTVLLACVALAIPASALNILGIFPSPERANWLVYREVFRELATRGHQVTLITHFALPSPPPSYSEIILTGRQGPEAISYDDVAESEWTRVPLETLVATKAGHDDCRALVTDNRVLHLLQSRPAYNLAIAESYNSDCAVALASNLTGTVAALNPGPAESWQGPRLGIPWTPPASSWLYERLQSYILHHVANWVFYVGSQVTDRVFLYQYLGDELATLEALGSNVSLTLVNSHRALKAGRLSGHNVVDIGGVSVAAPRPLPEEIDTFLSQAEHGAVYISLGPRMQDSTLPQDSLQGLVTALGRLKQRVLWRWEGPPLNTPPNVKTVKWVPQNDVLNHEKIKAWVHPCEWQGVLEAAWAGVPGVAVGACAAVEDLGVGVVLGPHLTANLVADGLRYVLGDECLQRASTLQSALKAEDSTLKKAVDLLEYAALHPTAFQPLRITPTYDVIACLLLTSIVLLWVVRKLCCCCCGSEKPKKMVKRVKFE